MRCLFSPSNYTFIRGVRPVAHDALIQGPAVSSGAARAARSGTPGQARGDGVGEVMG